MNISTVIALWTRRVAPCTWAMCEEIKCEQVKRTRRWLGGGAEIKKVASITMMDRRRYASGAAPLTGKLPTDVSPRVILSTRYTHKRAYTHYCVATRFRMFAVA